MRAGKRLRVFIESCVVLAGMTRLLLVREHVVLECEAEVDEGVDEGVAEGVAEGAVWAWTIFKCTDM